MKITDEESNKIYNFVRRLNLDADKIFELNVMMTVYIYLHNTKQTKLFTKPWKEVLEELITIL